MKSKLRNIWYALSSKQRFLIRRIYFLPIDTLDLILGKRHKYVPPRGLIYTGSAKGAKNYIEQGSLQLEALKQTIDLRPNDTVLDIGSGIGRTAIALTSYLSSEGRYEGFDVVELGVDWCNSRIGKDFPNFHFKYVALYNDLYNDSENKAVDFVFPYPSDTFDKIFSFSLFTHMQIADIENYFGEINRVLKKDGLAFSTFFLYDDAEETRISENGDYSFSIIRDGYRLMSDQVKAGNVAIHKDKLAEMMSSKNLVIDKIIDGFWKGENTSKEFQDIVVFKRKTSI